MDNKQFSTGPLNAFKCVNQLGTYKELKNKKILLFTSTPLINFSYEDVEKISKLLTNVLKTEFNDCEVQFRKLSNLPRCELSLTVEIITRNGPLYKSLMLTTIQMVKDHVFNLPLICVIFQNKNCVATVHSYLEQILGCSIKPIQLSEKQINWLLYITLEESFRRRIREHTLYLNYIFNESPSRNFNLTYEIEPETLQNLWLSNDGDINSDMVNDFIRGINQHCYNSHSVSLDHFKLKSFSFHKTKCNRDGKTDTVSIQINNLEILYDYLSFFQTFCINN